MPLFGKLMGRWRGALAAGVGIAIYTLLVGASPSVVRAALMGGLGLFARQVGRRQEWLARADHGREADVGGGGEVEITVG